MTNAASQTAVAAAAATAVVTEVASISVPAIAVPAAVPATSPMMMMLKASVMARRGATMSSMDGLAMVMGASSRPTPNRLTR